MRAQSLHVGIGMGSWDQHGSEAVIEKMSNSCERGTVVVRPTNAVLFHPDELLYVAIREARALAESGYAPPATARAVPVAGRGGIATLEMTLVNMRDGGMISAYDYQVARAAAVALCGGEVDSGSLVDEAWLLTVERRLFVELLKNPQTQARIQHMLETGKPLRN